MNESSNVIVAAHAPFIDFVSVTRIITSISTSFRGYFEHTDACEEAFQLLSIFKEKVENKLLHVLYADTKLQELSSHLPLSYSYRSNTTRMVLIPTSIL